jgi:ribosome maturation factor RimP
MAATHDRERQLTRKIAPKVEGAVPGTEVLAVELSGRERFTVYIDHAQGVDHALCERVTNVLRDYLREYAVDVSSPGSEPPIRRPEHFRRALGHAVALKTSPDIEGRRTFRGELRGAGERDVTVAVDSAEVHIPYDAIVRANLIDNGKQGSR